MFGYVRIMESELKVREYTLYKGVYCGLCRVMGKHTCKTSSLTLSYDFTFLAFFRAAMTDEKFELYQGRCGIHPFKKRPMATENPTLRYCAGAAAVLNYYKLLDDLVDPDKRGLKKLAIRFLLPLSKRHLKAAERSLPTLKQEELSVKVSKGLAVLSELEKTKTASPDACADAFGNVLSAVFAHGIEDAEKCEISKKVGYHIGKWIYLADAINDLEDDKASGSFNPFLVAGYEDLPRELLYNCLTMELGAVFDTIKALNILYDDIKNILLNIVTLGMPAEANRIFSLGNVSELTDHNNEPKGLSY